MEDSSMKRIIAAASFVALSVGAAAAGAQVLKGSDTLNKITDDLVLACPGAAGIDYQGGGSGGGENAISKGTQQVAPMSRFLAANTAVCDATSVPDSTTAEGINFATDKLAIFINPAHKADCDPGADDACAVTKGFVKQSCPALGSNSDWKNAIRLVYFGLNCDDGITPQLIAGVRDCTDPARMDLLNNWGNLFEAPTADCAGTECTQLRHAFRRDEQSGTTDAFRELVGANVSAKTGGAGYPFCNEYPMESLAPVAGNVCTTNAQCALGTTCVGGVCTVPATAAGCGNGVVAAGSEECDDGNNTSGDGCSAVCLKECGATPTCSANLTAAGQPGGPGLPVPPFGENMQDCDPARRTCVGNYNLALGSSNMSTEKAEEVCGKDGTLGVVLPISPPQSLTGVSPTDPVALNAASYPAEYCRQGRVINGAAPLVKAGLGLARRFGLCPDSRVPRGTVWDAAERLAKPITASGAIACPIPATATNDARCLNGRNSKPAIAASNFVPGCVVPAAQIDGRAFNLVLRTATGGIQKTLTNDIVGAFYRMHTTRQVAAVGADGTCADGSCCKEVDATRQLGCFAAANACSISFAGIDGTIPTVDVTGAATLSAHAVSLQSQSSSNVLACASYPMTRPLFLNTLKGFENVTGTELALAQCFSGNGGLTTPLNTLITNSEFIVRAGGPVCTDFNGCGDAVSNACVGNPAGIAP
jgi:cysteine-rich repeat protein